MQVASNLPITSIRNAPLPQTYQNARTALAECQALDECQDWADKAAALASYARQADDVDLEKMAIRIRSRALRRAGELLKQIEPNAGGRPSKTTDGTVSSFSRKAAAEKAGMSERQQVTAVRIANIPKADFERQIESSYPPTVTELAQQGTQPRKPPDPRTWLNGRSPDDFNLAMRATAAIKDYAKALAGYDWERVVSCLDDQDRKTIRKCIASIDAVHDKIVTRI